MPHGGTRWGVVLFWLYVVRRFSIRLGLLWQVVCTVVRAETKLALSQSVLIAFRVAVYIVSVIFIVWLVKPSNMGSGKTQFVS